MSENAKWLPKKEPWIPADYDDRVVYAVRAFAAGRANDGQQGLLWDWIQYVAGADDMSFRPESAGGERATAFAEGKRFVGQQIRKMLHHAVTPKAPEPQSVPDKKTNRKSRKPRKVTSDADDRHN